MVRRRVHRTSRRPRAGNIVAFALSLFVVAGEAQATRIVVLQASDSPRLVRTLGALQKHADAPLEVVYLASTSEATWRSTVTTGERPAVIVALGPLASDFIVQSPQVAPVVHCLAGADALRGGFPALPSEVPADAQAAWLRKLLPAVRTVGLAFDPATNTRRAEAIAAALAAAGYQTLMAPVPRPSAIPAALEQIAARADVLLALPDPMVYTGESARGILLHSFRRRTPVIGPNDAWVRMGALYAVDWDYEEVGATCARLARETHTPRPPTMAASAGGATVAPKPRVSVNMRSASEFGLQWNPETLRDVDVRHE